MFENPYFNSLISQLQFAKRKSARKVQVKEK
jgi:hypothetical protein